VRRVVVFFLLAITVLTRPYAKDRWRTNIYQSSASAKDLVLSGCSEAEKNRRVQDVLANKEKWCDEFIRQNPGRLKGVFLYKGKKRIVGIGYDSSVVKARNKASQNNLEALEESGLNKLGMYATVLKIQTKNGYFIFAILRSTVDDGFKAEDFNDNTEDVLIKMPEE